MNIIETAAVIYIVSVVLTGLITSCSVEEIRVKASVKVMSDAISKGKKYSPVKVDFITWGSVGFVSFMPILNSLVIVLIVISSIFAQQSK